MISEEINAYCKLTWDFTHNCESHNVQYLTRTLWKVMISFHWPGFPASDMINVPDG